MSFFHRADNSERTLVKWACNTGTSLDWIELQSLCGYSFLPSAYSSGTRLHRTNTRTRSKPPWAEALILCQGTERSVWLHRFFHTSCNINQKQNSIHLLHAHILDCFQNTRESQQARKIPFYMRIKNNTTATESKRLNGKRKERLCWHYTSFGRGDKHSAISRENARV